MWCYWAWAVDTNPLCAEQGCIRLACVYGREGLQCLQCLVSLWAESTDVCNEGVVLRRTLWKACCALTQCVLGSACHVCLARYEYTVKPWLDRIPWLVYFLNGCVIFATGFGCNSIFSRHLFWQLSRQRHPASSAQFASSWMQAFSWFSARTEQILNSRECNTS